MKSFNLNSFTHDDGIVAIRCRDGSLTCKISRDGISFSTSVHLRADELVYLSLLSMRYPETMTLVEKHEINKAHDMPIAA